MQNKKKWAVAVLLPVLILLSMTVLPLKTMLWGEEILLKTIPLDPTDFFRGDYVILNFEISQISLDKFPQEFRDEEHKYYGKTVYAVLKPGAKFPQVDRISLEKPKEGTYLKCRYNYIDQSTGSVHVSYPFDRYFIPENRGRELDQLSREGKLVAKIKVSGDYALLLDVFPE